jgi:hypothetical protein
MTPPRRKTTSIDAAIIGTDTRVGAKLSPGSSQLQEKARKKLDKMYSTNPTSTAMNIHISQDPRPPAWPLHMHEQHSSSSSPLPATGIRTPVSKPSSPSTTSTSPCKAAMLPTQPEQQSTCRAATAGQRYISEEYYGSDGVIFLTKIVTLWSSYYLY